MNDSTKTKDMRELKLGMTNFDLSIDDGFEEALRAEPGKVFGRHNAWAFNGRVWFEGDQFHEEVWIFGIPRAVISAATLQELMEQVNATFGSG